MPSTAIGKIEYEPSTRRMTVDFVTTGRRYVYFEVPEETYSNFRHAFAKGVHFNRHIRGRFRSELLFDPAQEDLLAGASPTSATMPKP